MTQPSRAGTLRAAAGIDPHLPPAVAAAQVSRSFILRGAAETNEDLTEDLERGWFSSPWAMAQVQAEIASGTIIEGAAFGGGWPYLEIQGLVVAPGLPAAVGAVETDGPDGAYRATTAAVFREAAGREATLLHRQATSDPAAFDLLWFGHQERYLVRGGVLEVEDLFCRLSTPAGPERLERLLVRHRRLPPAVLDGIGAASDPPASTISVDRQVNTDDDRWLDPAAFLRARVDIEGVSLDGSRMRAETAHGAGVLFDYCGTDRGWTARRTEGDYPFDAFSLDMDGGSVALVATLGLGIDPLRQGMRGRLAFDLVSDLVALQNE